jgi:urease accessory protein UreF
MPRPSVNEVPMTGAERPARYRAAAGAPVVRTRHPTERADRWMQHRSASRPDRRSRIRRWNDTVAAAAELQAEYAGWLDALPDNQQDSPLAEALRAIVELDLSELQAVEPPRGFGRD